MADQIRAITDQRKFTIIYNDFLESKRLDYYEKMVFIAIKRFADNETLQAFPSLSKLSEITGISHAKIRRVVKSLEAKGVIKISHRESDKYGHMSNIYTLYDYRELWTAGHDDEINDVDEQKEQQMINYLRTRGYKVEKKLESEPAKEHHQALNHNDIQHNNNKNTQDCQGSMMTEEAPLPETWSLEQVKKYYDYDIIREWEPYGDLPDTIMNILHEVLNTTKPVRIGGEEKPAEVVKSKLLKLTYAEIIYSFRKFTEQTGEIKNPVGYMIRILYNAREQYALDVQNQVQRNI